MMSDTLRERVVAALGDAYEVGQEIGRGGMGVVYKALDRKLRRPVAVKVLPPELAYRDDVKQRFLREAQTAAGLSHPHIVPIYAVEEKGGLVCFVMALVDGESLAARLARESRPPLADVVRVLSDVADALDYAHARGIVHRDIKPDNILVDRLTGRAMVTDFGIARAAEGDSRLTVTGIAVGTPAYMSPEQAMGEREIDGRSDIYGLAIVGYQMLAGELPFRATNTPSMLMKHISDTPPALRELRADLPYELVAAIERGMAKKPSDRWALASQFRNALGSQHGTQPPPSDAGRPKPAAGTGSASHLQLAHDASRGEAHGAAHGAAPARPEPGAPERAPERSERPSQGWKHPAPDPRGLAGDVRDIMRGASDSARDAARQADAAARDAVDAANAGWRSPVLRDPSMPLPLAPVPPWMPSSWREARRQWRGQQRDLRRSRNHLHGKESLETFAELPMADRIRSMRRRTASGLVSIGMMAAINLSFSPDFWWFLFPAGFMTLGWMQRAASLWADGVRMRDVFGRDAHRNLQRAGGATSGKALPSAADYAAKLAPADVVAGPYGDYVRRAAADRMAVHEVIGKLTKADSDLIPDVAPTVDALAERVGAVAAALHRLEEDVRPSALDELDRRIAAVRNQAESTERDRTLQLLERQRTTIADLVGRRETLLSQLESASLRMQTLRLDMIALRSAGVQSAMDDVSSATQEARAVSRDIAHVLDAAREVR